MSEQPQTSTLVRGAKIRQNFPGGFRPDEWGDIIGVAFVTPKPQGGGVSTAERLCYHVRFADGVEDYWTFADNSPATLEPDRSTEGVPLDSVRPTNSGIRISNGPSIGGMAQRLQIGNGSMGSGAFSILREYLRHRREALREKAERNKNRRIDNYDYAAVAERQRKIIGAIDDLLNAASAPNPISQVEQEVAAVLLKELKPLEESRDEFLRLSREGKEPGGSYRIRGTHHYAAELLNTYIFQASQRLQSPSGILDLVAAAESALLINTDEFGVWSPDNCRPHGKAVPYCRLFCSMELADTRLPDGKFLNWVEQKWKVYEHFPTCPFEIRRAKMALLGEEPERKER